MILDGYPLKDELHDAMDKYERSNPPLSPRMLVEQLLEEYFYKHNFLTVEINEEEIKNPFTLMSERQNKFTTAKQQDKVHLYYDKKYDFGVHDPYEVRGFIQNLMNFPDGELKELSKNNWHYSTSDYIPFLQEKFENPNLTIVDYLKKQDKIKFIYPLKSGGYKVQKGMDGEDLVFGSGFTIEEASKLVIFLVSKKWNKKYTTKNSKRNGKKYKKWILNEIDNDGLFKE